MAALSIRSTDIKTIQAHEPRAGLLPLIQMWEGECAAIKIKGLFSAESCDICTKGILQSEQLTPHHDVPGLSVLGYSHFQVARNKELSDCYFGQFGRLPARLRQLSSPHTSPFDALLGWLSISWPSGCKILSSERLGYLSPFTIRAYGDGVGIEPHLDIIAAEDTERCVSEDIHLQFGVNLYMDVPRFGGELELFSVAYPHLEYEDLASGPKTWPTTDLPTPLRIKPSIGEVLIFPSHRLHSVAPSTGPGSRVTLSFFIGVSALNSPLLIWA